MTKEFGRILDHLTKKTTTKNRERAADMCVKAWQLLQEKNRKDITLLATAKAIDEAIPNDGNEHDLAETAAVILTLVPAR